MNPRCIPDRPDYDPIASFYQRHWCGHYHQGLIAMLHRLVIDELASGARILDVCCGTGTVARHLAEQGFAVTGLDASPEMLRYARKQAPNGEFIVADARQFCVARIFEAALCTFDSVSYLLSAADLLRVFSNVHAALIPDGRFVFDLSLEDAYKREWDRSCTMIDDDEASFIRGSYDEADRLGRTFITRFHRNGTWQRTDVAFVTRSYELREISEVLKRAGFTRVECHRSDDESELRSEIGPSRACVVARA